MKRLISIIFMFAITLTATTTAQTPAKVLLNGKPAVLALQGTNRLLTLNGKIFLGDRDQIQSLVQTGRSQVVNEDFMHIAFASSGGKINVWCFHRDLNNTGPWGLYLPYSYSYTPKPPPSAVAVANHTDPSRMDYEKP